MDRDDEPDDRERRREPRPRNEGEDADDWLGEHADLDWTDPRLDEARAERESPPAGTRPRAPAWGGGRGRPSMPLPETIARRRLVAVAAAAGIVVVAVVAVVAATSGGGGSTPATTFPGTTAAQPAPQPPQAPAPASPATTAATPPPQPAPSATGGGVTLPESGSLRRGDAGSEVVALQKALAALGLQVGEPDGSFGPTTEKAVVAFQTAHDLDPDGVVGAATARALNEALASSG
jgi:hypothetical protein